MIYCLLFITFIDSKFSKFFSEIQKSPNILKNLKWKNKFQNFFGKNYKIFKVLRLSNMYVNNKMTHISNIITI